ncbi:MAG: efflux RND transporter periplasmic adaptor subunit [Pseudomonadota bacterium]
MRTIGHVSSRLTFRPALRLPALAALLALTACGGDAPAGGGPGGAPGGGAGGDRPMPVTTVRLQPETFAESIAAIGTVKARESITVTAKVSELVQAVHFDSGDEVRAGAPLVTLSDRQQQAALAEAQAAADEAERLFRRQSELAAQQLIARAQLDNQRAARDAANARVAQIRAQLADRVIRAPFAGVLGLRQVSPGALVTPGTAVATLDDLARVFVDFPLPETQLSLAAPGRGIVGRAAAWPGRTFEGVVATVDARVDPSTRAVTVRADLPNPERLLRPGMLVNVDLPGAAREALRVPEIAVVQVGRDSFVYRVKDDGSVERVDVVVGARADGKAEIVQGAKAGDRIVVDGTGKLRPGAKVVEAQAADPKPAETAPVDAKAATAPATSGG